MKEKGVVIKLKEGLLLSEHLVKKAIYKVTEISCEPINYTYQLHQERENLKANSLAISSVVLPISIMTLSLFSDPKIDVASMSLTGVSTYLAHATFLYIKNGRNVY
jgi:hypothetical protein